MVGCLEFLYITVGFISLFLLCHSFRAAWGVYLANVDCLNGTNRSSACLQVLRLWMDWLSGFGARQTVFRLDCLLHIGTFFSFVFRFPFFSSFAFFIVSYCLSSMALTWVQSARQQPKSKRFHLMPFYCCYFFLFFFVKPFWLLVYTMRRLHCTWLLTTDTEIVVKWE